MTKADDLLWLVFKGNLKKKSDWPPNNVYFKKKGHTSSGELVYSLDTSSES